MCRSCLTGCLWLQGEVEFVDGVQQMSLPASPVDLICSMNSVTSMSGVYGVTPRLKPRMTGSSLSARSTVTTASTTNDLGVRPSLLMAGRSKSARRAVVPEPEPEPEPELKPIPVHWGRTHNAALPKLAPPERFNVNRARDVQALAARRAEMAGAQQQAKRALKLLSEESLTQVKTFKEREHDKHSADMWSQDRGRSVMRSDKDELRAQISSGLVTLETLLGAEGTRSERQTKEWMRHRKHTTNPSSLLFGQSSAGMSSVGLF